MNRPNIKAKKGKVYFPEECLPLLEEYIDKLEHYCDYLESKVNINQCVSHHVSESSFNDAIKHVEDSYCDTRINTPYMLMGDVCELIKILTGKEVDWQELAKHSR